ncbi:Spc97/Spc98 [Cynara cardunculus var. scolymus]|uniref:Gamma-tubulin complex component n=1 Tax=Cynara cardunculus var. scolymus TaxID=59895 RepID=A0A103YAY6_CYNCS|nr:Spc97/Spc98 [Cynara cardunculus var. scolymus]
MDAVSSVCPSTPQWNISRPFLTGQFHQEVESTPGLAEYKGNSVDLGLESEKPIGCYSASVQELIVIDDLLSALIGIEGRYISINRVRGNEDSFSFHVDGSMDLALQARIFPYVESSKRIFPLCRSYLLINQFVESRSQFKSGLVNHAFAAALRALLLVSIYVQAYQIVLLQMLLNVLVKHFLPNSSSFFIGVPNPCILAQDYQAMVAQLEHQFRLGRLSIQGLWFYCQPMMGSMLALSIVIRKASSCNFVGSAVLNLLQNQAKVMAGNYLVRSLLEKMIESANSAYLGILERWVYEGVIDDPHDEFFIAENKSLQKESLTQDYDAMYWRQRYSLKDDIPSFLANSAETILTTGKYLNVMRECGHSVQVPALESSKLMNFGSNDHYLECIKSAYDFASSELLNLMKDKYGLVGKLRSIKHYLLLDQGDFLVHFMDIARDELAKTPNEISVEKLQSLLDLALRSTAAAADPLHEDVTCSVDTCSLLKRLGTLKDLQMGETVPETDALEESLSITGVETFSVNYKVQWPLSLVISRKALTKYQLIFRFLFHCKHVHRQLCAAWQVHQGARARDMHGTGISTSSILCRNMLKFINSLLHYLTFEVLEPNWHVMHNKLENAKSIDEVIQYHDFFMEKCLKECSLLSPVLLKKLEKLKLICLQYAAATQWLMNSIESPYTNKSIDGLHSLENLKVLKLRKPSKKPNSPTEESTVIECVLKFEREFTAELQSLRPILSSRAQAEPYLTHLAQLILGVGMDQQM